MRTIVVAIAVLAGLLGLAPAAYAKGPTAAAITGPGLAGPVRIESYEATQRLPGLDRLMQLTGGSVLFGNTLVTSPDRPAGDLGPRYTAVYYLDRQVVLSQEVYPFAAAGPFTYTPAGQHSPFTPGEVPEGWFRAPAELASTMVRLGAPEPAALPGPASQPASQAARQPAQQPQPAAAVRPAPAAWWLAAVLGAVVLAALAGVAVLRARTVGARR